MTDHIQRNLVLNFVEKDEPPDKDYFQDFQKRKRSTYSDDAHQPPAKYKKKEFDKPSKAVKPSQDLVKYENTETNRVHKIPSYSDTAKNISDNYNRSSISDRPNKFTGKVDSEQRIKRHDFSPDPNSCNDNLERDDRRGLMTSLFKGNPDIPYVPESGVERISEKVFSDKSFSSLNIANQIVSNLQKFGFSSMTLVQEKGIPCVLSGQDCLIKSQTGSGKTLSYAVPIIHNLMSQTPRVTRSDGLLALIVVPTRELALQSYQWFEKLCKSCVWVVPGYLIGGEKKKAEKARLRKGVNILVATPGRLIDHVHHTKNLSLSNVQYLVIDEADRLLDLGYERNMTSIIESLNEQQPGLEKRRQTIMLSATLSPGVEKLAGMSLQSPKTIDISAVDSEQETPENTSDSTAPALATPKNLSHYYLLVPAKLRLVTLAAFVLSKCMYGDEKKIIIFFATQDMVDYHTALFSQVLSTFCKVSRKEKSDKSSLASRAERVLAGFEDESDDDESEEEEVEEECDDDEGVILFQKLHGNMTQEDRSAVFKSFREAAAGVLMCTDVASRGLDMPKVCWIVQFNAACTVADYVHRVGRTARVDAAGSAIIFLAPAEVPYIRLLEQHRITLKEVAMQNVLKTLKFASSIMVKSYHHAMEESATGLQLRVENLLLSDKHLHDLARKAYVSFVRSYASYPKEVRDMFSFKALHLGHYAKSMGLRDTPAALGASAALRAKREIKERAEKKEKKKKMQRARQGPGQIPKHAAISEFDSGLDCLPKKGKKK
ncbi:ATPdependent RNA helicase [Halocaridina rubra]|uniref:ATP-dependent RNA helicase n=1 Tax=Halocaridina rubra TaxID=373956 RepID=A0AAN8WUF0_HALRR